MTVLSPDSAIIPIVRYKKSQPISELLGTGFFVGSKENLYIVTAKHVFLDTALQESEEYAFAFKYEGRVGLYRITNIIESPEYDIAAFKTDKIPEACPLPFSEHLPALNDDVLCYEYSLTEIERTIDGKTKVKFAPMTHKGNIMRPFVSNFPRHQNTPCYLLSFPALQGASGAPVLAHTESKVFYVAGMVVANFQKHLMPAQIVRIEENDKSIEETKYFLPLGVAINASVIVPFLRSNHIEFGVAE